MYDFKVTEMSNKEEEEEEEEYFLLSFWRSFR